ncbi:MAG TPA: hypothetical protein ENL18_02035, partial [Thermoplasmatales archaeon]|nr:hypothetical protein [Thermoplasmatales archaeon]
MLAGARRYQLQKHARRNKYASEKKSHKYEDKAGNYGDKGNVIQNVCPHGLVFALFVVIPECFFPVPDRRIVSFIPSRRVARSPHYAGRHGQITRGRIYNVRNVDIYLYRKSIIDFHMKFLFLYPTTDSFPLDYGEKSFMYAPPLGILYLSSVLRENGHGAGVIDIRGEEKPAEAIKRGMDGADAVGITVPTFALNNSKKIVDMVKDIDPSIPVIIGGPHPTLYPRASLKEISADMVVAGEAENSILDVAKILEGSKRMEEGRGVYYRKNDEIH